MERRRYVIEVDLLTEAPIAASAEAASALEQALWADPQLLDTVKEYGVTCTAPECSYLVQTSSKEVAKDIETMANRVGRGGHQHVMQTVVRHVGEWKPVA